MYLGSRQQGRLVNRAALSLRYRNFGRAPRMGRACAYQVTDIGYRLHLNLLQNDKLQ